MANVTTSPGVLILDTAGTIKATGSKVRIVGFVFVGSALTIQNGAGAEMIRLTGNASYNFGNHPLMLDGLIVAAGVTGTATIFTG